MTTVMNFKDYKSSSGGNVAMMFAVCALVLVTGVGAAVDLSNMSRTQTLLQSQVDAAVLAAATVEIEKTGKNVATNVLSADPRGHEKKTRKQAADEVIKANGFDLTGIDPVMTLKEQSVIVKAEVDYKPFFGGILGMKEIRLIADAESGLPGAAGVEIALVLDNTDSMRVDGKMAALKESAIGLVDAIEDSGSESQISLVPFARYVRLNESVKNVLQCESRRH